MNHTSRVVIPVAAILLALLIYIRHDTVVKPYELGWNVWVFALCATSFGLGYGYARKRSSRPARLPRRFDIE